MTQQETKQRPMASEKACTKCGETKPLDAYHRQKAGKYGRHSQCKLCTNAAKREFLRRNPEYRERQLASAREYNKTKYREDADFRERTLVRTNANGRKRREDPEKLAHDRERARLYRAERYRNDPEYRERHLAYYRARYANDPEYRERQYRYNREATAKRSARVTRIRQLLDHFEGRDRYLDFIAHAVDARSDAQGLQWLCNRIDWLVASRVYGEA